MNPEPREWQAAVALWPKVYGFARQFERERGKAEDLAQEAYFRLARSAERVDLGRPLLPLLRAIVRHVAADGARRRVPYELEADSLELPDEGAGAPPAAAELQEEIARVQEALARMSATWRAALYLADGLDFSYAEIAEALGLSEDAVRTVLHRARLRVRVLLKAEMSNPPENRTP